MDVTYIVYLDDILIFSKDISKYKEAVRQVFDRLRQYSLFVNL